MSLLHKDEEMISVGIDIGTSTTKMVISRFILKNTAGMTRVPTIEIVSKKIIYQSPIFRTPLKSSSEIDLEKLEILIMSLYKAAAIVPEDVQTGAVIITGETATKSNAEEVIHYLSSHGGDFLVATAGPDLEGIIAAKGTGLFDASKQSNKVFANIDIGGGTANIAVYQYGNLLGTCTLHIGGKLIEFENGVVHYISNKVKNSFKKIGVEIKEGSYFQQRDLKKFIDYLVTILARTLVNQLLDEDHSFLLGHPPNWTKKIDVITFSGGVAECMYRYGKNTDISARYNDIGMILAESLLENKLLSEFEWRKPNVTVHATVIGASTQTTEISGATIHVESSLLPIKNLPVHQLELNNNLTDTLPFLVNAFKEGIKLYDPFHEGQNFALFLSNIPLLSFREIHQLIDVLIEGNEHKGDPSQPLVLVLERDLGKAIGQSLQNKYPDQKCICIDQIKVEHGDYLDIGKKLQSGVVPVVIKTLAF